MPSLVKNLCAVCNSPDKKKLEQLIAQGADMLVVADTFEIPDSVLRYHRDRHMRGVAIRTGQDAIAILRDLTHNAEQCQTIITWAMERQKMPVATLALRNHREALIAIARITGADRQLDPRVVVPFWDKIKSIILKVAEEHPEVGDDLMEAIGKVEESR
jgi:hypothetical protein